ncbi:MAG TPA: glycosyltransferase [Ignavibacteria bacterium]
MKTKELNLLVLIKEYPNGLAVTKKIQNILYYLFSQKIEINVISYRSKFPQPSEKGLDNGIPYVNIGIGLDLKLLNLHKTIMYLFKGLYLILKHKKKGCKNIFYCIGAINIENLLFVFWARLLRYKLVFDVNEDYSFFEDQVKIISRFKIWTIKQLDFFTYRWATAIIVVSTHLRNKYLKRNKKHILLIPVTAKENFNPNKSFFNDPLQVVYAGSFDIKDGVNYIIEGFNSFNNIYHNARLILTGKSDQQVIYQEKYKSYSNIIFKGHLSEDEFYDLLKNADVMCMCRTNSGFANAGFPFKLGEYLATGNPVISTKASDVENYLTKDDAYLIDFNSPQQIGAALTEIVNNPDVARKIGLNGMKKYQKYFSSEVNGKLLYDLLITIASE